MRLDVGATSRAAAALRNFMYLEFLGAEPRTQKLSQLFILRWSAVPSGRSKPNRADNIMTAARLHAATLRSILRNQMFLQLLGT